MPSNLAASVTLPSVCCKRGLDEGALHFLEIEAAAESHAGPDRPGRPGEGDWPVMRGGRSRTPMRSPRQSATPCSMAARSSRTLPGQS